MCVKTCSMSLSHHTLTHVHAPPFPNHHFEIQALSLTCAEVISVDFGELKVTTSSPPTLVIVFDRLLFSLQPPLSVLTFVFLGEALPIWGYIYVNRGGFQYLYPAAFLQRARYRPGDDVILMQRLVLKTRVPWGKLCSNLFASDLDYQSVAVITSDWPSMKHIKFRGKK